MTQALQIIQIVVILVLIGLILIQSQNSGLSPTFGGGNYRTKRGVERVLLITTIVFATVFLLLSLLGTVV